eukprot:3815775-Pyramimonas_sp.AAC.1
MKTEKRDFSSFLFLAPEASSMCSDDRCARKELYEVLGGNQVDGLPPAPSFRSARFSYLVELFDIDELEE